MNFTHTGAALALALAALMFSSSGLLIKVITIGPLALIGARGLIAASVIALYNRRLKFDWSLAQVGGALALAGAQTFFVIATRQTSAANAIFIQFTAPIFVAVFAIWYLGEPARLRDWLAIAVIGVGLYLFVHGELTPQDRWGNINALLSGVSLAWFILFMRRQKDVSTVETAFLGSVIAGLVGLPFLVQATPTAADWGGLLFLGVLQMGVPILLLAEAIKSLRAVEAVLIQALEPILNPVWVFLAIGERPSSLTLLGGALVLIAVTARSIGANREVRFRI